MGCAESSHSDKTMVEPVSKRKRSMTSVAKIVVSPDNSAPNSRRNSDNDDTPAGFRPRSSTLPPTAPRLSAATPPLHPQANQYQLRPGSMNNSFCSSLGSNGSFTASPIPSSLPAGAQSGLIGAPAATSAPPAVGNGSNRGFRSVASRRSWSKDDDDEVMNWTRSKIATPTNVSVDFNSRNNSPLLPPPALLDPTAENSDRNHSPRDRSASKDRATCGTISPLQQDMSVTGATSEAFTTPNVNSITPHQGSTTLSPRAATTTEPERQLVLGPRMKWSTPSTPLCSGTNTTSSSKPHFGAPNETAPDSLALPVATTIGVALTPAPHNTPVDPNLASLHRAMSPLNLNGDSTTGFVAPAAAAVSGSHSGANYLGTDVLESSGSSSCGSLISEGEELTFEVRRTP